MRLVAKKQESEVLARTGKEVLRAVTSFDSAPFVLSGKQVG